MTIQNLILHDTAEAPELFFHGALSLKKGGTVSLDSFYNSFCYTKYRDYTTLREISFSCLISGKAIVRLCVFDGSEQVICDTEGSGKITLSVSFSQLPENGFLYPKITALSDCELISGEYRTDCMPQKISCCIAICTYRREPFVKRNSELLRSAHFSFIHRVFVIDNGNTLDADGLSDGFITVLPNKNLGGSGGFTRGLIEAHDGGFSHVILMDDDVEFFPETLEQMTVFVSLLKKDCAESWFGTAMIPLDRQWQQFELGAQWNGKEAVVHKYCTDLRNSDALLDNLTNPDVEYSGWWTLCMPTGIADKVGLPYPFFIKFDDTEYGMRKPQGTEIITMNGIAVRHEAFDRKASFVLSYYNLRNELVVNSIYGKYGTAGIIKRFCYEIAKHVVLYRYDNIPLVIRAAEDFLGGVNFFLETDGEELNLWLYSHAPKLGSLSEIPQWSEALRCDDMVRNKTVTFPMTITLGGHLIPSFLLKKDIVAAPLSRVGAVNVFMRKQLIQYQQGADVGIMTRRSLPKLLKYGFLSLITAAKLLFKSHRTIKDYQRRKHELCSEELWKKQLEI